MSMDMTIDQLQLRANLNSDGVSTNSSDDASQSTTASNTKNNKRDSLNANAITDLIPGGYHCSSSGD